MDFVVQNKQKFEDFRKKYTDFSYKSYSWINKGSILELSFVYAFSGVEDIIAKLEIILPEKVSDEVIKQNEDFIFYIGLIEALSYWKAYCSPVFHIICGNLSEDEISWWRDTFYDGMGEFRYRNGLLDVKKEDWVQFFIESPHTTKISHDFLKLSGNLIGFTGGKDSTLTLALLKDYKNQNETFFVSNPEANREKIKEVLQVTDCPETVIKRTISEKLISMNQDGALNGHTPFSIVVGFTGLFAASLRGRKYVIVSNEASANEATVAGTDINHQYSKSLIFEKRFQNYSESIWPNGPKYFSLLRPFSEAGIVSMLKAYPEVMSYISSCNSKSKTGLWCGKCPKCLFAFIMFGATWDTAFAEKILGVNMLTNTQNSEMLKELTGVAPTKPFECVGTVEESIAALAVILDKNSKKFKELACEFHEHLIPEEFEKIITKAKEGIC